MSQLRKMLFEIFSFVDFCSVSFREKGDVMYAFRFPLLIIMPASVSGSIHKPPFWNVVVQITVTEQKIKSDTN